ncbi:M15 family metallopeptidase [Azorhizobium sp. AG788]|uniref:M15 family metallopeptidase n=1 Tax=Azorhizobium sp. AG788 TaxID=2183897 RepID=UPI00313A0910
MNPFIVIAATLFPDILKIIAGDKTGSVAEAVIQSVQKITNQSDPNDAKQKVSENPVMSAELQQRLAEIALESHKADLDAASSIRAEENQYASSMSKLDLANTMDAREALQELVALKQPISAVPMYLSYGISFGFFVLVIISMTPLLKGLEANGLQIVNICLGAVATAFATVVNFWLGSSQGSRNKDWASELDANVAQAKSLTQPSQAAVAQAPARDVAKVRSVNRAEATRPLSAGSAERGGASTGGTDPSAAPSITLKGKMSTFGGPTDPGVAANEGLALITPREIDRFPGIFLDEQPPGTTGLARRLNPEAFYIACRWDRTKLSRSFLQSAKIKVANPASGLVFFAQPVDRGPGRLERIADLSPGLAKALRLSTDDICEVTIPLPSAEAQMASVSGIGVNPKGNDIAATGLRLLSTGQIERIFGKFEYQEAAKGEINIIGDWETKNIIEIVVPQLSGLTKTVRCHEKIVGPLKAAFEEVETERLLDRILIWDGAFSARHIGSAITEPLSRHSWGIAFDINTDWNGYGDKPAPFGSKGSVIELVPIFEKHGFYWGGRFSGKSVDGMHFEYCIDDG